VYGLTAEVTMYDVGKLELEAVRRVLASGQYFRYGGKETALFEREWAGRLGVPSVIGVTSGTAALITALKAMGIGPGDSVLVPGYTFISTALAVTAVGAVPIYVDIDDSLTMCPEDVAQKIRRHTACMIPVHMQGMPCDMAPLLRLARKHGVRVLEDCCQAAGGGYRGKPLGAWGDMSAFSFNQYKIICCGEGGACATSDPVLAERACMAQDGSCSVWPETGRMSGAFFCGGNFRMNELNAAVLRKQVGRLDGILRRLRGARASILEQLRLPAGARVVRSHDETGNCGVCFLVRAESVELAKSIERLFAAHLKTHRPIDSGRHVYSAWDVVNQKIGGHHPEWDCFRHPKNRRIATHYDRRMKKTDAALAETVLCHTPYRWREARLRRAIDQINEGLARIRTGGNG